MTTVRRSSPRRRVHADVVPRAAADAAAPVRARKDAYERGTGGLAQRLDATRKLARSNGPEGTERMVTARDRVRLEELAGRATPALRTALDALVAPLEGPAAAVMLRAISARASTLESRPGDLDVLREFGARLKGMEPGEIARRATSLDLDSRRNDSPVDLGPTWERRGVIHLRAGDVSAADNDGLVQRFTASCGTTVLQMMLAEADPVFAFALHDDGLQGPGRDGTVEDFQRQLLEAGGGVAMGRVEASTRSRLRNALGRLQRHGDITPAQKDALLGHALKQAPLEDAGRRALRASREAFNGFPSDEDLRLLRASPLPDRDEGIPADVMLAAMERLVTPRTGVTYTCTTPREGFERGQAAGHLDDVERALKQGADVPFGISEPAHWMLLSAVRGSAPRRQWLVSDPDTGRTAWVVEKDLVSGVFADRQFHLCMAHERPYVDTFFLPAG